MQVQIKDTRFPIVESEKCWENEKWEDAEDFKESLEKFMPPTNNTTAR